MTIIIMVTIYYASGKTRMTMITRVAINNNNNNNKDKFYELRA